MFIVALAVSHVMSAALCYKWAMLHWPVTQDAVHHKDTQSRSISSLANTHVSYGEQNWGIFWVFEGLGFFTPLNQVEFSTSALYQLMPQPDVGC